MKIRVLSLCIVLVCLLPSFALAKKVDDDVWNELSDIRRELKLIKQELSAQQKQHQKELRKLKKEIKKWKALVRTLRGQKKQAPVAVRPTPRPPVPPVVRRSAPTAPRKPWWVKMRKNVQVRAQEYAKGAFMLTLTIPVPVKGIWVRLGAKKPFRSTGLHGFNHPSTGKPMPKMSIMTRKLHVGKNDVWIQYRDGSGKIVGPLHRVVHIKAKLDAEVESFLHYQWPNPVLQQLRYRTYRGTTTLLPFWTHSPKLFHSVRYSLSEDTLHRYFIRHGKTQTKYSWMQFRNLTPGKHVLYVQGKLRNGWKTPLLRYVFVVNNNGKWTNVYPEDEKE